MLERMVNKEKNASGVRDYKYRLGRAKRNGGRDSHCFDYYVAHRQFINCYVLRYAVLPHREKKMLETIAVILLVLWLLGLVSSYTMGGFIHILLVIAIVAILIRLIRGRGL